jgi:hypothetical protein
MTNDFAPAALNDPALARLNDLGSALRSFRHLSAAGTKSFVIRHPQKDPSLRSG